MRQSQVAVEHRAEPDLRHSHGATASVAIVRCAASATLAVECHRALPTVQHSFALIANAVTAINVSPVTYFATNQRGWRSHVQNLQLSLMLLEVVVQTTNCPDAK